MEQTSTKTNASDWKEYKTKEGKVYYHKSSTNETTWTKPTDIKEELLDDNTQTEDNKTSLTDWIEHKTLEGKVYYHNTTTDQTSWVPPEGTSKTLDSNETPETEEEKKSWREHSSADGKTYYHNLITNKTSWVKPPSLGGNSKESDPWQEYKTAEGKPYYFNTVTGVSSFTKCDQSPPIGFPPPMSFEEFQQMLSTGEKGKGKLPFPFPPPGMGGIPMTPIGVPSGMTLPEGFAPPEGFNDIIQPVGLPPSADIFNPYEQKGLKGKWIGGKGKGGKPGKGGKKGIKGKGDMSSDFLKSPSELADDDTAIDEHDIPLPPPPPIDDLLIAKKRLANEMELKKDCRNKFKEMLREMNITISTTWKSILPKVIYDQRYQGFETMEERRDIFDDYQRELQAEQPITKAVKSVGTARKPPKIKQKGTLRDLLKEAIKSDTKMDYQAFQLRYENDSRYKSVNPTDRRAIFDSHLKALRTSQNDKKSKYFEALREIENLPKRWSQAEKHISRRLRKLTLDIPDDSQMKWFDEYWDKHVTAKDRQQAALRQLQKDCHDQQQTLRATARKFIRENNEANDKTDFLNLVSRHIKHPVTYKEARQMMKKDSLYEQICDKIPHKQREEIYQSFVSGMETTVNEAFTDLLFRCYPEVNHTTKWEDALTQVKREPNYSELPEDQMKSIFGDFIGQARLRSTSYLRSTLEDMEMETSFASKSLSDMHILLRSTHSYKDLTCDRELRESILSEYAGRVPPSMTKQQELAER